MQNMYKNRTTPKKKLKLLTRVNLNFPYSEFFLIRQMKTSSNLVNFKFDEQK